MQEVYGVQKPKSKKKSSKIRKVLSKPVVFVIGIFSALIQKIKKRK